MVELLKSKTVVARKPHGCMTCNATAIRPGVEYQRDTYIYDGRVYDWVQCVDCAAIAADVFDWADCPDYGVDCDDYAEWTQENNGDPRAVAYLARLAPATREGNRNG